MPGYIDVNKAMADAEDILNKQEELGAQLANVRGALRNAVVNKETTAEQAKWIRDTFPEKKKRSKAERVKALQDQLADAEKAKE